MFWELSGDKGNDRPEMEKGPGKDPQPGHSLVKVVKVSCFTWLILSLELNVTRKRWVALTIARTGSSTNTHNFPISEMVWNKRLKFNNNTAVIMEDYYTDDRIILVINKYSYLVSGV
jgi:hypothetical protein